MIFYKEGSGVGGNFVSKIESMDKAMKQYSVLVRVPETYGTSEAQKVGPLWEQLLAEWKKAGVYVLSFAFPGESYTITGAAKEVKQETVLANHMKVVSNLVLQAGDWEKVIALAKACPVLNYGGSVEIREIPKPIVVA